MPYRAELDGLRAIAVLSVILFHVGFEAFSGGFVGVDVFFVMSGYLITGSLVTAMAAGSFSLLDFYERRVRRILPALFLVVLVSLGLAWLWLRPADMADFARSLVAVPTFSSNVVFWLDSGYWGAANELKPLLHTWTLAIEAQFYVLFPLYLMGMARFHPRWAIRVLMMIMAMSFTIAQWGAYTVPVANFFLLPSRLWELVLGALVAFWQRYQRPVIYVPFSYPSVNQVLGQEVLGLLGVLMIGYAVFTFDATVPFPSVFALIPTIGTSLVILFAWRQTWVGKLLSTSGLVHLGTISYSLYLWHYPLLAFARHRTLTAPSEWLLLGLCGAALPLAYLTWRYVEQPFRNNSLISRRAIVLFWLMGSLALIEVGLTGQFTQGFSDRAARRSASYQIERVFTLKAINRLQASSIAQFFMQPAINQIQRTATDAPWNPQTRWELTQGFGLSTTCDGRFILSSACRTSDEPEILVWGDSFAMHLVPGILESNPNAKLIQVTKSVCGPFFDVAPIAEPEYPVRWARECLAFTSDLRAWLQDNRSVKYAVLSSPFSEYLLEDQKLLLRNGDVVTSSIELAMQELDNTLDELKALGINPIVFAPPPTNDVDLGRCLTRADWLGMPLSRCNYQTAAISPSRVRVYGVLDRIQQKHRVFRLDELVCRDAWCQTHFDDVLIYRDGSHLSDEGSAALGKKHNFYDIITGG
jgi:peptidoglycan/LPS O-acetylase OafA/YrhL